jgi:hypothetical protein
MGSTPGGRSSFGHAPGYALQKVAEKQVHMWRCAVNNLQMKWLGELWYNEYT